MALKDIWKDKTDNIDDVLAEDINAIAQSAIQSEENLEQMPKPDDIATKNDLSEKVDKVSGKGLSTNDFTTEEKEKLEKEVATEKGVRTSLMGQGIYATESKDYDFIKEIYLIEDEENKLEDKPIIVSLIRKNFSASNGKYWTGVFLSYKDTPGDYISFFHIESDEKITELDRVVRLIPYYGKKSPYGYVVIDFDAMDEDMQSNARIEVNAEKAKNLALNPTIHKYLLDKELLNLNSEIEKLKNAIISLGGNV